MKAAALLLLSLLLSSFAAGLRAGAATDANTADQAALERVAGIGPAIAARIVASRRDRGPFRDLDDLRDRVRGIGEANVKKMAAGGLAIGAALAGGGAAPRGDSTTAGDGASRGPLEPGAGCARPGVELIVGNARLPAAAVR